MNFMPQYLERQNGNDLRLGTTHAFIEVIVVGGVLNFRRVCQLA